RTLIERAMQAAGRGGALTQQLLAFSRRQSLRPTRFDVNRLAEQLEPILRGTLSGAVVLDLSLGAGLPEVEADANQLENAILNLVINARDAMPEGGLVRIETSVVEHGMGSSGTGPAAVDPPPDLRPGRYVCIAVADTGSGMTPEIQASAFEPFFTTKPVGQGSGLGLSQVYGFVKQSQGSVALRSVEGAGTIVSLFLPAAREAALAEGDDAPPLLGTAD
ncbi:ATP-binding protein, partial [Acidisphaera rubrifaciens]|uniref:ATP-binding protein n=1 Tax=Acidisphaera rubrifaciens TaxID=50715 RepID=UPI001F51A1CF